MLCLDTNIIIELFRGDKILFSKLKENLKENQFCTTFLNLAELFKGAYLSNKKEETITLIENFIKTIIILPLEKESCKIYGEKFNELQRIGKKTEEIDLLIASIVLANNTILITRNKKHFENISGLKIIEW